MRRKGKDRPSVTANFASPQLPGAGKVTANLGGGDTVSCAPVGAFGFIASRPVVALSGKSVPVVKMDSAVPGIPGGSTLRTVPSTAALSRGLASGRVRGGGRKSDVDARASSFSIISSIPAPDVISPADRPSGSARLATATIAAPSFALSAPSIAPNPAPTVQPLSVVTAPPPETASAPNPSAARAFLAPMALAAPTNVMLDGSLNQTGQPTVGDNGLAADYAIDASLGNTVDRNLFLSFARFRLETNESATFTGPGSIRNILARVTGGEVSEIDGLIDVQIPGANLFLMNPSGFIFGSSASVNVSGSFAVTTADYLKLADGARFSALPGAADNTLTSASVSDFGFLPGRTAPPAGVTFSASFLFLSPGTNFSVVSGNQVFDGAILLAPAGRFTFVSVAGAGEVPAESAILANTPLSTLPALGRIDLQNFAFVSTATNDADTAGHVDILAGALSLSGSSQISASSFASRGSAEDAANSISIRSQSLLLSEGSTIQARNLGSGVGGEIRIQSNDILLTNGGVPGSVSQISTITSGEGLGGGITIATDSLTVVGSNIESSTVGRGDAGNISITANRVSLVGESGEVALGILAESGSAGSSGHGATGRGGDIFLATQSLSLSAGGQISATTFGSADGGNVSVSAHDISITGSSSKVDGVSTTIFQSGILASSRLIGSQGSGGQGGDVTVATQTLGISNNGLISASTMGSGGSGNVTVTAGSILLDGAGATMPTGITATTSDPVGGSGGDIRIGAASLVVVNGAEISAATAGTGSGGSISVAGGSVRVSGAGSLVTAQTTGIQGGAGGSISLNVDSLSLLDAGQISASTSGSGRGGSIIIDAGQVTVEGSGSAIAAESSGLNSTVILEPRIEEVSLNLSVQTEANVRINITLTIPSDRQYDLLTSGQATGMDLIDTTFSDRGLTPIADGSASYTGTFQPVVPLSVLNGGTANGTWLVSVGNLGLGMNDAILQALSLTVNGQQFAATNLPALIESFLSVDVPFDVNLPTTQARVLAGAGGSIQINAGTVTLRNGGSVNASTSGDGAAGSLNIRADTVAINASGAGLDTGFFASTMPGSTGAGGSISVETKKLQLTGGRDSGIAGGIVARSSTLAAAGNIILRADDVSLDGRAQISSANIGTGPAGSVDLRADKSVVLRNGSLITVVSQQANAGTISIEAGDSIELRDNSTITASAGASGGSIVLQATERLLLDRSSIVATAGGGNGGNISIDPIFIILNQGLISANALGGAGGNILIEGRYFFANHTPITATGTTDGTVQITTLPLDIVNALAALQGGFIDLSSSLQESCTLRLGLDTSSFLVIGRGGVEDSPDEPRTSRPNRKSKAAAR